MNGRAFNASRVERVSECIQGRSLSMERGLQLDKCVEIKKKLNERRSQVSNRRCFKQLSLAFIVHFSIARDYDHSW